MGLLLFGPAEELTPEQIAIICGAVPTGVGIGNYFQARTVENLTNTHFPNAKSAAPAALIPPVDSQIVNVGERTLPHPSTASLSNGDGTIAVKITEEPASASRNNNKRSNLLPYPK